MNLALLATAASVGVIHTAIGVDHYIPFVAMSKANKWSFARTMLVVFICGAGHVLSSVLLGLFGVLLGSQVSTLVGIEDFRGVLASWFLVAFGLIYMLWGIRNAVKNKPHKHTLNNGSEVWHNHPHEEHDKQAVHEETLKTKRGITRSFWPLFVLLVLGPCEPLIPLLMYPAAHSGMLSVAAVASVFAFCTIATMLVCSAIVLKGISFLPAKSIERYAHALAGFSILVCGFAVVFLGI